MSNKAKMTEVLEQVKANRAEILQNSTLIYDRRAEIESNHAHMSENAHKISAIFASK